MKYNKRDRWLNVGCGVGLADTRFINIDNFFTLEDLKNGKGKDGSPYKNARIPKGAKFVKADILSLPFEDNSADYIECVDTIEHIGIYSVEKALKELYRVLKPGCMLGISTTNFDELARLWTLNVTGNQFRTQKDFDAYHTLSKVIYGNQAGPGEYHKVPFNPFVIGFLLQSAGFKVENIVIKIFPTNSPEKMPIQAYENHMDLLENTITLTEMMWVESTK